MLFAPFPRYSKAARAPESQASAIMRRRCESFLQGQGQGDFEKFRNALDVHTLSFPLSDDCSEQADVRFWIVRDFLTKVCL